MLSVGRPVAAWWCAVGSPFMPLSSPILPQSPENPGLVGSFSALLELFLVFFFMNKT